MRGIKFIFFAVLFQLVYSDVFPAIGCLGGGTLYTNNTGVNNFGGVKIWDTPATYSTSMAACPRTVIGSPPSGSTACAYGFLGIGSGSLVNYTVFFPPVDCPLDDYVGFVLIGSAAIAMIRLRQCS